ncbi:MAG: MBL fold metallo-hydrolase, partial [Clostridia bacterium]|nr:MBL fold metallo-hydrolase [Clostridia bacterium]
MRKNLKRIACLLATVMGTVSISACGASGALESILENMGAVSSLSSDFSSESLSDTAFSVSNKKESSSSKNESSNLNFSSNSNSSIHSSFENSSFASNEDSADGSFEASSSVEDIETNEFSIHFLELGNKYTGDSTLIKVGDVEVLIDAGSRQSSAATITEYVNQYCEDGVLEYVIATHAHQDHIAGFVGTSS